MSIEYILMDVEGTTTSKRFVYETLFPYARAQMESFVLQNLQQPSVQIELSEVVKIAALATSDTKACIAKLIQWTLEDKKIAPLKNLQGLIWQQGYESGAIKGHVYPEVRGQFELWIKAGKKLGIYSSGSVLAQKLIFGFSISGDLTPYLSHYFDPTMVGHKQEASSYKNILDSLKLAGDKVLFLSDRVEELEAAALAGMQVAQIERPEDKIASESVVKYKKFQNFLEIKI
jgi:enolase-phosphatase E1